MSSGVAYIDALLQDLGSASDIINRTTDSRLTLTYRFEAAQPTDRQWNSSAYANFQAFTDPQKALVRTLLDEISEVVNLTFTEETSAVTDAALSFGRATLASGNLAVENFVTAAASGATPEIDSLGIISANATLTGAQGRRLLLNALGLMLTLKNPGNYGNGAQNASPYLSSSEDNNRYTLMSRTAHPQTAAPVDVLMPYDIAALQYRFGAVNSTRSTDTTYAAPTASAFSTVWDGGGTDTLDLHASRTAVSLNLAPGGFSSVPVSGLSAASNNLAIAYNVDIENATGGSGNDTLLGNDLNNVLSGNAGNDSLNAGNGNDSLLGGAGNDTLVGGAGDDFYGVNSPQDVVVEDPASGADTVQTTSPRFTLPTDVEHLIYRGSRGFAGSGNAGNNSLQGGPGDDSLDGSGGTDSLIGGAGNDIYVLDEANDFVSEAAGQGTDEIRTTLATFTLDSPFENLRYLGTASFIGTGNASPNLIAGGALADSLDGGGGADSLIGGAGDDLFLVDGSADSVIERPQEGSDTVRTAAASYTLAANIEILEYTGSGDFTGRGNGGDNQLQGGTGNDSLVGLAGADTLVGGAGDDVLNGGTGNDSLSGGAGNDTYMVDAAGDVVVDDNDVSNIDTVLASITFNLSAGLQNLTLTGRGNIHGAGNDQANLLIGNAGHNSLYGDSGADSLVGGAGNDTLVGGMDADTLVGGVGDDAYYITDASEAISEASGEGADTVYTPVSFTLAAAFENLTFTGRSPADGVGNALNNVLTGNGDINSLWGGDGSDTLQGGDGADTLNGGTGADTLEGGNGSDVYFLDNIGDTLRETGNDPQDSVFTSLPALTLPAAIELAAYTGSQSFAGTGSATANSLVGNSGNDRLRGLGGNDTLEGGDGSDTLDGGSGDDFLRGGAGNDVYFVDSTGDQIIENASGGTDSVRSASTFTLPEDVENLLLTGTRATDGRGNALANTLTGNAAANALSGDDANDSLSGGPGNDTLDGGAGGDTLVGGRGDDVFLVDDPVDMVIEAADSGNDTVQITTNLSSYTLPANVENLSNGGAASSTLTGNVLNNRLAGGSGVDTLSGGAGNDTLQGNAGDDTAVFNGSATDYQVRRGNAAGSYTLTGPDGTDLLLGIEWVQFGTNASQAITSLSLTTTRPKASSAASRFQLPDMPLSGGPAQSLRVQPSCLPGDDLLTG